MQTTHLAFLVGGAALLCWAVVRWKQTARSDADYAARRDVALLLMLLVVGVVGDAVRMRFPDRSLAFLIASMALIPLAGGAIIILIRLIGAYRRSRTAGDRGAGHARRSRRD